MRTTWLLLMFPLCLLGCGEERPDASVVHRQASKLATAKGLNPIGVEIKDNNLFVVKGELSIANNQMGFKDGDLVYNVGMEVITIGADESASGAEFTLGVGECAVVRDGKLEKLPDRLGEQ